MAEKRTAYEATTRTATILDNLKAKRHGIVTEMLRQVFAVLSSVLRDGHTPTDDERDAFVQRAQTLEQAATTAVSRLSSSAYRQILSQVYEESSIPQIAKSDPVFNWGKTFDEVYARLDAEEGTFDEIIADEYADAFEEIDDNLDDTEEDLRSRVYSSSGVKLWRRVTHPEFSETGVCGLCLVASTRPYRTPKLKKIHARCKCTVLPLTKDYDLGKMLGELELGDLYRAASDDIDPRRQSTDSADLKRVRVAPDGTIIAERGTRNRRRAEKGLEDGTLSQRDRAKVRRLKQGGQLDFWDDLGRLENQLRQTLPLQDSEWKRGYVPKLQKRIAEIKRAA